MTRSGAVETGHALSLHDCRAVGANLRVRPHFDDMQNGALRNIKYNMKIRFFYLGMTLACIISIGIFMQSCSQEDMSELPCLEINSDISKFSESDLNILQIAHERMDKYIDQYNQGNIRQGQDNNNYGQ
jgi:hypothetical protein